MRPARPNPVCSQPYRVGRTGRVCARGAAHRASAGKSVTAELATYTRTVLTRTRVGSALFAA